MKFSTPFKAAAAFVCRRPVLSAAIGAAVILEGATEVAYWKYNIDPIDIIKAYPKTGITVLILSTAAELLIFRKWRRSRKQKTPDVKLEP